VTLRRASGGALAVLASALAFGFLTAHVATATPLPPSLSPLPGSSFQGADGNQDDALPAIDWQAMQRPYRRACRVACLGLTARTIGIDRNEGRKLGIARGDAREMGLKHSTCGNLTPCQSLGQSDGRQFARTGFYRHGARMHELRGNDDSAGMGFAFPLMSGGMLHG